MLCFKIVYIGWHKIRIPTVVSKPRSMTNEAEQVVRFKVRRFCEYLLRDLALKRWWANWYDGDTNIVCVSSGCIVEDTSIAGKGNAVSTWCVISGLSTVCLSLLRNYLLPHSLYTWHHTMFWALSWPCNMDIILKRLHITNIFHNTFDFSKHRTFTHGKSVGVTIM